MTKYSDLDYNMSGLYNWEKDIFNKYFKDCRTILVSASGGGREVVALSKMGINVEGFECCKFLADSSRALLKSINIDSNILDSEPNKVPENLGIFDGIVIGWGGYIHIPGSENRVEFLKGLRKHLEIGSPILVSFLVRDLESKYFQRIYKITTFISRNFIRSRQVEIGDDLNITFDHFFIQSEIEKELKSANFNLIHYTQDDIYPHAVALAI